MADSSAYEQIVDRDIEELVAAEQIKPTDLFVVKQDGSAKKMTGQVLLNWLTAAADGHGGIQSIEKLSTNGLADAYRITLADTTIFDFVVTNGRGISGISKTATSGLADIYTISYNDGSTGQITVTNGDKGDKGDNAYVWIKYASQEPTEYSHSMGDIPDDWIGIYSGNASSAPSDWKQYQWFKHKGEKGDTGDPALLVGRTVTYLAGDSGTIVPSGAWSETVPVVAQGKYLWTKIVQTFNTGDPITFYSVSRMGLDGLGSVVAVCGQSPDASGNVALSASDVGALPVAGGTLSGALDMGANRITNLQAPVNANDAARKTDVDDCVPKAGGTMTGNLSLPAPTEASHAANKAYVDTVAVPISLPASGWEGDTAPFVQTVTVAGLTDGRRVRVYPAYGDDADANLVMREACACLSYTKRDGQNVTFTCLEDKPAVDINVIAEVYV